MTKDLSRQLCELCGIEGKWIEYETETTDGCINLGSKLVYPDFTKPENFVRLYEILHGQSLEGYLKYLCIRITYEKGWSTEAMKAAIREAEWVYG